MEEDGTPVDTSAIAQGLSDPQTVASDGLTVSAKPMADLVLGIQFQAAAAAAVLSHRGLRFNKIVGPPQLEGRGGMNGFEGGAGPGGFN
jgi:hypothetical protein